MTVDITTRPSDTSHTGAGPAAGSRSRRPPRRRPTVLAGAAVLTTAVGSLAGATPVVVVGLVVAAIVGLRVVQLARRRPRAIAGDADGFGPRAWSVEELASWPALASRDAPPATGEAPGTGRAACPAPGSRHLLDRWTVTQVLWAGLLGWLYNALAAFAERLVAGSSFSGPRALALAVVAKLLPALRASSLRRTVAISALATVTTTGAFATAAGAAEGGVARSGFSAGVVQLTSSTSSLAPASYTVRPGDTLSAIAARFGTTVAALAARNHLSDPTLIFPGQTLAVGSGAAPAPAPSPGTVLDAVTSSAPASYTVRPGDTLSAIAARFGTTVAALAARNHLSDPTLIYPGQTLAVGSGAAPAPAPSPSPGAAAPSSTAGYANPLRAVAGLTPGRIDQGIDYEGSGPVYAIGDGVVLDTANAGWPGGAFISYRLTDGPAAGDIVYVAENVVPAVRVGQQVTSSTVVGTLVGASPYMEIGWAAAPGDGEAAAAAAGQWSAYADAHSFATAYGENFSQLLGALGAPGGRAEGPVQGTLPAGWPSW